MNLKVYHAVNVILGSLITIDGLYWLVHNYQPFTFSSLSVIFTGIGPKPTYDYLVGFPLVSGIILPVYPISIFFLGLFMLALDRNYPRIAIPLWLMACGAFDVLYDPYLLGRIIGGDFWPFFQLGLMFGGWLMAGMPKFRTDRSMGVLIAVFVLTSGGLDPYAFELALFGYIAFSTVPNLRGKPLDDTIFMQAFGRV